MATKLRGNCAPGVSRYTLAQLDEMLFPTPIDARKRKWAKLCKGCPVMAECAAFGEATGGEGVYGGEYRAPVRQRPMCPEGHYVEFKGVDCDTCEMIRAVARRQAQREEEAQWTRRALR